MTLLRTPGMLYQQREENKISNLYNYKIINKTNEDFVLGLRLENLEGDIQVIGGQELTIKKQSMIEGSLFIILDKSQISKTKTSVEVGVYNGEEKVDVIKSHLTGPIIRR